MEVPIPNVKNITFERFFPAADGESIIFEVKDARGTVAHISIAWAHLATALQVIDRASEKTAERRKDLGKANEWDGIEKIQAQIVKTFQVSEVTDQKLKILSLQSPTGLRCDFAIPMSSADQRGRPMHRAIAEELTADLAAEARRPN